MVAMLSGASVAQAQSYVSWSATTPYPVQLAGSGCISSGTYIYCVGGFDVNYNSYDDVYYAPVTSTGVGSWATGTPYPTAVDSASCVGSNSTIYCVGGEDGQVALSDVFWTSVSPTTSAPGAWVAAAAYPLQIVATSCVVSDGYVYCVGGFNGNGDEVSSTYYSALGSPGINSWTGTTAYPKAVDSTSCVASGGYIFCVAGEVETNGNPNNPIDNVYYAPLTSSGIGSWTAGPSYPAALAAVSCVAYSGYVYCVGGFDINSLSSADSYYASISPSGVGPWQSTSLYPLDIDTSSCVLASSSDYCIGGVNELSSGQNNVNYVYFSSLSGVSGASTSSTTTTATTSEFPVAASVPVLLAVALCAVGAAVRAKRTRV